MMAFNIRVGHGYDVHKFGEGRPLILGGVKFDCDYGLIGHSDADVVTHSVMDALLGAAGLPDIGRQFPDNDDKYLNISSVSLLSRVGCMLSDKGYRIGNVDVTVIAEQPKLAGHTEEMKHNISAALECDISQVNIKATTEEGLGFTGRREGIASHAVCLIISG